MNHKISYRGTEHTADKGTDNMPTMDAIEYERVTYVKEMQDYLQKLKNMSKKEAKKKSFQNLVKSEIIHENGEFTDRFEYTKETLEGKR